MRFLALLEWDDREVDARERVRAKPEVGRPFTSVRDMRTLWSTVVGNPSNPRSTTRMS